VDPENRQTSINRIRVAKGLDADHANEAQYGAVIVARERKEMEESPTLSDEAGSLLEPENYVPNGADHRSIVERQIADRRGREAFRRRLLQRYGWQCQMTGSKVLAVLEAAHVEPYKGAKDNHIENGLILRADIHTLFDLHRIGIRPDDLIIELVPSLMEEYGNLAGTRLKCPANRSPSRASLGLHYWRFQAELQTTHSKKADAAAI
jgi:hypothetical protein